MAVQLNPADDKDLADAIEQHYDNGVDLRLADGTYEWSHQVEIGGKNNWSLIGDPNNPSNVKIKCTAGHNGREQGAEFKSHFGSDFEIAGFTVINSKRGGSFGLNMMVDGSGEVAHVHDIHMTGYSVNADVSHSDEVQKLRIAPVSGGTTRLERIVLDGPCEHAGHGDGFGMGVYDSNTDGTVVIRDMAVIEEAGDGPFYGSQHGNFDIKRWYARNNDMSQCRIGPQATIEDAQLVYDPHNQHPESQGDVSRSGSATLFYELQSDQKVESSDHGGGARNVDIIHRAAGSSDGFAVKCNSGSQNVTLEDVRIQYDGPTDNPAVLGMAEGQSGDPGGGRSFYGPDNAPEYLGLRNVSVNGDASPSYGAVMVLGRDCDIDLCTTLDAQALNLTDGASVGTKNIRTSGCATAGHRFPPQIPWYAPDFDPRQPGSTGGNTGGGSTGPDWRTIAITGNGSDRAEYSVSVTDQIENDPLNGSFDSEDSVDGTTASGVVVGGTDGFRFTGDISGFDISGPATITVDGEETAPENVVEADGGAPDESEPEVGRAGMSSEALFVVGVGLGLAALREHMNK